MLDVAPGNRESPHRVHAPPLHLKTFSLNNASPLEGEAVVAALRDGIAAAPITHACLSRRFPPSRRFLPDVVAKTARNGRCWR
jgi:hypothetical protein